MIIKVIAENNVINSNSKKEAHIKIYRSLGFHLLRIAEKKKSPLDGDWPNPNKEPNLNFEPNHNVGVLSGINTSAGYLTIVDFDLPRLHFQSSLLYSHIIEDLQNKFGTFVKVLTEGKHKGSHGWFFLDHPIKGIVKIPIHIFGLNKCEIEIKCQSQDSKGYNTLVPDSFVEEEYKFHPDHELNNLEKDIHQISGDEFVNYFSSIRFQLLTMLIRMSSILEYLYKIGVIEGHLVDMALSHYLLEELKITDDDLIHFAFKSVFNDKYEYEQTEKMLSRTSQLLQEDSPTLTIGSICDKIDDPELLNEFQNSLKELENLYGSTKPVLSDKSLIKSADHVSPILTTTGSIDNEEGDMFYSDSSLLDSPEIEMLIEDIFPSQTHIILHGPPGEGKTTASLLLSDIIIRKHGNHIVYFPFEQKAGDIGEKLRSINIPEGHVIVANPKEEFLITNKGHQNKMVEYLKKIIDQKGKIDLVIIDSLMAITAGSLNDGVAANAILVFNTIASQLDTSVLLIHHNNKSGENARERISGSSMLAGSIVLAFEIEPIENVEFARKLVVSKTNTNKFPQNLEIIIGQYPGKPAHAYRADSSHSSITKGQNQVDQCRDILFEKLKNGEKFDVAIVRECIDHFSESTISRASKQLGVEKIHENGKKVWYIPKDHIILKIYHRS